MVVTKNIFVLVLKKKENFQHVELFYVYIVITAQLLTARCFYDFPERIVSLLMSARVHFDKRAQIKF